MTATDGSPFHAGELELQERAGWREKLAVGGPRVIRDHMPDQHREFFAQLPFIAVGMLDGDGNPWAGILVGRPGFMSTPDDRHLDIHASFAPSNPLSPLVKPGANIGLLGIEFHTRRRNRANGVVEIGNPGGLRVLVRQSFGNCPKYIASRHLRIQPVDGVDAAALEQGRLLPEAIALIRAARTFFVASAAMPVARDFRDACDVSHRGGDPGFVGVEEGPAESQLWIPDYRGNNFFNTFGNILRYPRAGLAFPDFSHGRVLMLTGAAEVVWERERRGLSFRPGAGCWQPLGLVETPPP